MPDQELATSLQILDVARLGSFPVLVDEERALLKKASELSSGYPEYALLAIWNAAVSNLKRRVESYGVDLWISVVQEESGRKKYDKNGDSLSERWEGVDDLVLISGSTKLGLLNKKAGKSLEMINWMRNHTSAAHETADSVETTDVFALALLLQQNLFIVPLPDPGHSVSALFDPIKNSSLTVDTVVLLKDEIAALRTQDVRICFGFLLDILCLDQEPGISNATELFSSVWVRATEDLRTTAGMKYHSLTFDTDPATQTQSKVSKNRLLDILVQVDGIKYIPEASRAQIYRYAAKKLSEAKDGAYGWRNEEVAAKTLAQFGPHVPSVAFEDVYQEILAVWFGNYWGHSSCSSILEPFMRDLTIDQINRIASMFKENNRVKEEISQSKPKARALAFLSSIESRLTLETHKEGIRRISDLVSTY